MSTFDSTFYGSVETQTFAGFDIATVTITAANTEYTYNLPSGTKGFQIQNRKDGTIYLRKTSGGDYWTFFPGQPWYPVNIKGSASISLILSSNKANQEVEVLYWS